jgi:hypothetical protein
MPQQPENAWRLPLLRLTLVIGQVVTLAATWDVWQPRASPPLLPLFSWTPEIGFGGPLAVTALGVLVWPRGAAIAHAIILLAAIACDQTREQPQMIVFAMLMFATLPSQGSRLAGCAFLASMWFYAGLHKLTSPEYFSYVTPILWSPWFGKLSSGGAIAVCIAACLFHLGIFLTLSPVGLNWNYSVWIWNLVLAVVPFTLLWTWRDSVQASWVAAGKWARCSTIVWAILPLGYFVGVVDAYLAFCLYSGNTLSATVERGEVDLRLPSATWDALRVPIPPSYRTFRAYFAAVGKPGETLVITDPRWLAAWWGGREQSIGYEDVRAND